MNFKEALRKDTNYLRGLSYLDAKLRQNWINQNAARLRQARDVLTTDDYKTFAEDLYRLQMWNNLEAENINKGVYGQNFRPTREYIQNYFNKKVADIDFTLKYHPDLDENNVYVGSKKNTGLSPEMWNIYSNLKDEESKREFREKVQTENQIWDDAAQYQANEKSLDKSTIVSAMQSMGQTDNMAAQMWADNVVATTDENHPDNVEYLKKNKDKITADSYAFVNNKNTEIAHNIWSRSLKKYRQSKEYQKALNAEMKSISDRWNNDATKDKNGAENARKDEFLEAIKDNPVLMAASGYDPKTGKFSHEQFQQYESLLEEDPDFKAKYLANKNTLYKQRQDVAEQQLQDGQITQEEYDKRAKAGFISEDDYRQSLIDIANDTLKDHEGFLTRAANAGTAAATTGMTYTLHKFAPFVNTIEVLKKRTDGKVFIDAHGNIYQDSDITSNAQYTNPKDADSAILYKTSNGVSINYNRDGDKIFVKDGVSYIYQNEDGSFRAVDPNSIDSNDKHLRKVNAVNVKNTEVETHDLVRLGKDDSGNDLNWAGGAFNEKYLQLADRYNIAPFTWNHDEMDYYDQFGYSKYVNIQRPGDDSRDFWGEVIKMMGFVGADLLMTFATKGIGKAVGAGMRATRGLELGTGLMGAVGIADSYAQGIFEENLARNEQTLQNIISEKAKAKAEDWANTEGKELLNQMYTEAIKTQEKELGRPLTETEKAQVQMAVRAQAVGARAMKHYAEEMQNPDNLKMQEKAVEEAGNAAIVDFWGEGLKYGIVNTLGFRSWMFKSRNAAEQAARASEKSLFGKAFSRVGIATQADVDAKLAEKVGDVYLKDAWSKMSKAQKARAVLETTGKQFWGGAWTNWTDEMQSAGARAQNNSNFDAHLNNNTPSGAYLFANAIASQLQGIQESVFDPNSLWAGLIGGAGSVLGFGFNPMGIVEAVTNKQSWNRMSAGEKFNSIFSNSVLSEVYQQRANDYQAQQMLDRANAMLKSVDGNTISLMNALQSASRIGHSENPIEAEEADVTNLFHTLLAVDNFSKTNPGLAELDALSNIRKFAENAEKLADTSKLSDEEKQGYIEQIKVSNPNMTEEEATAELENVSKRAQLMQKMMSDWTNLQKSDAYKQATTNTEEKSEEQENMEQKIVLQAMQDYTLQNMREREQKIKGSTSIATIDGISTATANPTMGGEVVTTRAQENEELATYGNKKSALKNIKESHKLVASQLEQRKSNMEKAQANLNFEEKAEALKEQITDAATPTEKQDLQKKLADLIRDNAYYTSEIARIDDALTENANQQARLETLFDNTTPDSDTVLSARDILNLDPVARMRMLDSNNFNNYSKKQQTQIKKAIAELSKNGLDFSDIQNQTLASSRYTQRESMLEALANNETVNPSFRTRVTNMIDAANQMIHSNIKQYSRKAMKEINDNSATKEEATAKKLDLLRRYSPSALRYIKDGLTKADQKLVDEVLPMAETGEQLIDLIYNENYGLTGLNMDERRNLQSVVANTMSQSRTAEELIDNLATKSVDTLTPSINTLLDKLGQVYEQQHSTIVETAKEKAQRQANERRAAQAREQAAQAAVAPAENAPSVTPQLTREEELKRDIQLSEEQNKKLQKEWEEASKDMSFRFSDILIDKTGNVDIETSSGEHITGKAAETLLNTVFPELADRNNLPEKIEVRRTSKTGKDYNGTYTVSSDGEVVKIKQEGPAKREISHQEILDLGLTAEDVLGEKWGTNTSNIAYYKAELEKLQSSTTEIPISGTSRRGEKQLKKGFENLHNSTNPIEKGNAIGNIESNVYAGAEISTEEKATLEQAKQELIAQGYEVVDMLGKPYNDGMKVSASFIIDESAPIGSQTITRIIKPQINKNGVMVQAAEIKVTLGPEKNSLTKTPEELIQEAKNTILATQAQVQPTAERDPHADHYLINGEKYMRVHGAMGDVWVGPNSVNKEANSARSLKNGSIVDSIVRDFFNGITPAKPAHFSDEAFSALITSLETIKAKLIEKGEEFLTNNIVLYHKFPNGVKIAGEADIVSIKIVDGKPQYNIYDLKTSAGGRDGKAFNESSFWETNPNAGTRNTVIGTREQYTNQVSLYKLLFERMLNTPVTNLALLPYKLTYDAENTVTGIEKYPGIALTYNPNVEKLIAYQPAIDEAISRIQHTYEGMFTKEQLATIKGIIVNGIIKNENFAKDFKKFFESQGLPEFYEIEGAKFNPIIKDLKEAVSSIDVAETLKEEFKEPEPLPTPTPPAELATVESTGIEYSPTKESFAEPDVDAEFNALGEDSGSTQLQQTQDVIEEFTDMNLTTNAIEDTDINKETGEVAATIKSNPISPYVYEDETKGIKDEDRIDAKRGILVLKTPGTSMQNYNKWMQARKINLQGLIDDKLSDILTTGTKDNPVKIFFMRVNPKMTATGGHLMNSHYLLVVEDTPALRRVYTQADADKYGDFVTANGKQYLIVGTAGFANSSQGNAYRKICTSDSPNSVKSKSEAYFKSNANEEFYVDPDKYTHVARIHSGFIIKQLATDSMPKVRRISELLNDPERNPHGLTWDSLVFGYQMRNGFRTIPESDPLIYRWPAKAIHNIGNVFLYIKGADGRYTPTMLKPTRYLEISQGTLKTEIDNALRMLTSLEHAQRYKGLLALYNLVVLGQKDNNGVITGTDILIGTDKVPSLTFMLNGKEVYSTKNLQNVDFQEVLTGFGRLNPRISVTKSKLLSEEALKKLDAAGALRTDIARLGKASGDYAVFNIGSDGKPIITAAPITSSNAEIVRGEARRIRVDEQYYSKMGDKYINEEGNIVTDSTLLESIKLNDFILNNNIDASITIGTTEYFIPNMSDTQSIIARETGTHKASIVTDAAEISKVKEAIAKEKAKVAQASRDAAASAELEGTTSTVKPTSQVSVEPAAKPQTSSKTSIQDLLDMDKKLDSKKEASKQQIDTIDHEYQSITGNTVTIKVERTPILLKDLKPGDRFFNYRNELTTFIESLGNDEYIIRTYDGTEALIGPKLNWGDWVSSNPKVYRVAKKEATASSNSISTTSKRISSSQNINVTERKSLVDADNSVKNGTFAGEKDAFSIIQDETFQDAVLDECERLWPETADMGFGEIVEFLKSKGKVTTGIKDVKTWIDTLKC